MCKWVTPLGFKASLMCKRVLYMCKRVLHAYERLLPLFKPVLKAVVLGRFRIPPPMGGTGDVAR